MVYSGKRKYSAISRGARSGRMASKYRSTMFRKYGKKLRTAGYKGDALGVRVARIERTIETKEGLRTFSGGTNIALAHNNIYSLTNTLLFTNYGTNDPMASTGQRIGDKISLRGVGIKLMLQNQAERPRVFYRIMLIKSAKGDAPTRATLFKGMVGNKMLDQINTERYTIVASKSVNVTAVGAMAWTTTNIQGVPRTENGGTAIGGVATKIVSMWVPGRKLSKNGVIIYENESTQPKFFDYHLIILAYDWFGTPQDVNNVGAVSDGWIKMYYQDA